MKQKIILLFCCCLLIFLLLHPEAALTGARDGLGLWLNVMLPVLLPFLILTGVLIKTGNIQKLFHPFEPLWKKVFGLSPAGAYVLALGLLCGYPMGAKLAHDLYIDGQISRREGEYLLSFACSASPAFLVSYLSGNILENRRDPAEIVLILLFSDLLCMLFFRFLVYHGYTVSPVKPERRKKETCQQDSAGAILDVSIMNGFETITRLGGYILLFSLILTCVDCYRPFSASKKNLWFCSLELTTGLNQIAESGLPWKIRYLSSMVLTSFGGFCIMAQTKSVLENKLSMLPYITSKCLNAGLTLLLLVLANIV